jgi:CRISPR/Cas system-associated protein Csx1
MAPKMYWALATKEVILSVGWLRLKSITRNSNEWMFSVDEFIAKANIEHFKTLLKSETDKNKRRVLDRLLAQEESKLADAIRRRDQKREN